MKYVYSSIPGIILIYAIVFVAGLPGLDWNVDKVIDLWREVERDNPLLFWLAVAVVPILAVRDQILREKYGIDVDPPA